MQSAKIRDDSINIIARHIKVLNDEVGKVNIDLNNVKNDIKWIKKIIGYTAALITGIFVSVIGVVVKYLFL